MVMNGAAWWEIHSNMRSGRENVMFPEDYGAIKLRYVYTFDLLEPIICQS